MNRTSGAGIPRLYAAASLKRRESLRRGPPGRNRIPRLYAAASLKRRSGHDVQSVVRRSIPRLYAAASLKHRLAVTLWQDILVSIPRLYAAASLKQRAGLGPSGLERQYSAALCRGLIEAPPGLSDACAPGHFVFRGSMPRPH